MGKRKDAETGGFLYSSITRGEFFQLLLADFRADEAGTAPESAPVEGVKGAGKPELRPARRF